MQLRKDVEISQVATDLANNAGVTLFHAICNNIDEVLINLGLYTPSAIDRADTNQGHEHITLDSCWAHNYGRS